MDLKGIYDKVKSGGFKNPLDSVMNDSIAKLTAAKTATQSLLDSGTSTVDSAKLTGAVSSFTKAIEDSESMLRHSNILSGVDSSSGITATSLARLGQAAARIEAISGCGDATAVLGTLKNATDIIAKTVNTIKDLEAYIADIKANIDSIPAEIVMYANELIQQVAADVEALAVAKLAVINNAVAAGLVELTENPCFSGIFAGIMTDKLKGEVTKVTDKIKTVKLKSISG